jgi:hypothetical protein
LARRSAITTRMTIGKSAAIAAKKRIGM